MITYVQGDLITSDCDVIAHGCNCFNTWGAGIARQLRTVHTEAFEADWKTLRGDKDKLGTYTDAVSHGRRVFNLYTQYAYGNNTRHCDYDAIKSSLESMRDALRVTDEIEGAKIGLPKIGCGLAGGDWNVVEGIIEEVFSGIDIYVYVLDDGSIEAARAAGARIQAAIQNA
jgi:O-acetyl-ADP-ribose deacetylase (regulator of RNase III)